MEHNPYISLNDATEMTYSDIKRDERGEYITIYFETPADTNLGFNSAQCDYPFGELEKVVGYTDDQVMNLVELLNRTGKYALTYAKEDELCQVL